MTSQAMDTLTDQQAITVLALALDRDHRLLDPAALRELDAQVAAAARAGIDRDDTSSPAAAEAANAQTTTPGALARETLAYLTAQQPDTAPVIERAIAMTAPGTAPSRVDPVTLGVGALVLLALHTDVQLERSPNGKWRFKLHKKAMSDTALARLLGKLISSYTGTQGQ